MMKCAKCGKTIEGDQMLFCPWCGAKLRDEGPDGEVAGWIRKALASSSIPERKKILEAASVACPGSREIAWEMVFIGHPDPNPPRGRMDFSIIKSWLLQIYRKPGEFSDERRARMRQEIFGDPQLLSCLAGFDQPEQKLREYLDRLCTEYLEIFLEEDNRLMGNWFGLRLGGKNKEKLLAAPVAEMMARIRADEALTGEQRDLLRTALYQAYARRAGGHTEYLDNLI